MCGEVIDHITVRHMTRDVKAPESHTHVMGSDTTLAPLGWDI